MASIFPHLKSPSVLGFTSTTPFSCLILHETHCKFSLPPSFIHYAMGSLWFKSVSLIYTKIDNSTLWPTFHIPKDHDLRILSPSQRPHQPPEGSTTFFYGQLIGNLLMSMKLPQAHSRRKVIKVLSFGIGARIGYMQQEIIQMQ